MMSRGSAHVEIALRPAVGAVTEGILRSNTLKFNKPEVILRRMVGYSEISNINCLDFFNCLYPSASEACMLLTLRFYRAAAIKVNEVGDFSCPLARP